MALPKGWTEDTKAELYDPDTIVFFENSESCLFTVVIGKKSAGASVEAKLKAYKQATEKNYTEVKLKEFGKWSRYQGKGIEIEGKLQGTLRSRTRIFAFEKGDSVCVVKESAILADWKKFIADFEKIREGFKVK